MARKSDTGITFSRRQLLIVAIVVALLLLGVGLLAGLLGRQSRTDCPTTLSSQADGLDSSKPWINQRLPLSIIPDHYDLTLYPDFYDDHESFYGNVTIRLNLTLDSYYVLVHIKALDVSRTELHEVESGRTITLRSTFPYPDNQYWVIEAGEVLNRNRQYDVTMEFQGSLTNGLVGLYKSVYTDSRTGESR